MESLALIALQLFAFASGIVVSGGVFAFIASIGIVPRFAEKTDTKQYIRLYESCIIAGGIFGSSTMTLSYYIPITSAGVIIFALGIGVFVGCMAVSLAEILDVIPILSRRGEITAGISYFIIAIAFGKLAGSLIYYLLPGFYYIN